MFFYPLLFFVFLAARCLSSTVQLSEVDKSVEKLTQTHNKKPTRPTISGTVFQRSSLQVYPRTEISDWCQEQEKTYTRYTLRLARVFSRAAIHGLRDQSLDVQIALNYYFDNRLRYDHQA